MERCKACNRPFDSSEKIIEGTPYWEELCSYCRASSFSGYRYASDHYYDMAWYQEGLTPMRSSKE